MDLLILATRSFSTSRGVGRGPKKSLTKELFRGIQIAKRYNGQWANAAQLPNPPAVEVSFVKAPA